MTVTTDQNLSTVRVSALIGAGSGLVAGALVGLIDSSLPHALAGALALAAPLALAGALFEVLAARRVVRPGVFATVALFWLLAFPLARLAHEAGYGLAVAGRPVLPADVPAFLAFQGLVSMGYAIGFLWLRERLRRPRS